MENTSSPFIIMTFLFSVTLTTDITYCVVKYLRILFLYPEHTNSVQQIYFIFPTKTMYIPTNKKVAHTVVYIQKSKKIKNKLQCCILSSVSVLYAKALIANCKTAWRVFAHVTSQHIWMAVCSSWKQEIFCMKTVPKKALWV